MTPKTVNRQSARTRRSRGIFVSERRGRPRNIGFEPQFLASLDQVAIAAQEAAR